jgi:nucleotide-binding universal stress UspA family protein
VLERILVPLDGSPAAEAVLPQVRRLLKRRDADVLAVRAVDFPAGVAGDYGSLLHAFQRDAEKYVQGVEKRWAAEGARVRAIARPGAAADVILRVAQEERSTMIAMSTHGRTGLARWVFGSVAEKVLRASPIPVLAVRSFAGAGSPTPPEELPVRRILVPVDGSDEALAAIEPAAELAKLFGAQGVVATVEERVPASPCGGFVGEIAVPLQPPMPAAPPGRAGHARHAADRLAALGVPVVTLEVAGDAASQILDLVRTASIDLVAMATHGRSGLSRWVFGSVTEKVLRAAPVPVLIVRGKRRS